MVSIVGYSKRTMPTPISPDCVKLLWPAHSPDLNIIENVWLLLKNKIKSSLNRIRNLDDLKTKLLNAWNNVPLHYLQNLYGSMPMRIRQVLVQKGHMTKY
jgi:hypothetical protein